MKPLWTCFLSVAHVSVTLFYSVSHSRVIRGWIMYVWVLIQRASLSPSVFQDFPGLLISGNHFPGSRAVSAQGKAVHGGTFKFGGGGGGWDLIWSDRMINVHNKGKIRKGHAIVWVIWNWEFKSVRCIECNDFCRVEWQEGCEWRTGESARQEAVLVCFRVLPQHSSGESEKVQPRPQ